MTQRLAVVLMNLGGPDSLDAVRPFLKNLFSDPEIINLPWPLSPLIAEIISRRRNQSAQKIYQKLGGGIAPSSEHQGSARGALQAVARAIARTNGGSLYRHAILAPPHSADGF